ncbi:uncharacterized protein PG986_010231 [Apiospora aurea]|uniref:Uncharacterized protein n=1 Tax=Apiospora aurea TaxID=335848 RepID=A0ABR1QA79_9PEZI
MFPIADPAERFPIVEPIEPSERIMENMENVKALDAIRFVPEDPDYEDLIVEVDYSRPPILPGHPVGRNGAFGTGALPDD